MIVQACLNGPRPRAHHDALPLRADELAREGRAAVQAGADELHVHVRDGDGGDTLDPEPAARAIVALRAACPQTPLGTTTGLWAAGGDAAHRLELLARWSELPDFVSVNLGEPGFDELCALLAERGIGVEAGVWSVDDARALLGSPHAAGCRRVLVESALPAAAEIEELVAPLGLPQLHHASESETWPVLERALARGHDVRVGLEDTLVLADGTRAADNADLVRAAVALRP
jgi:uncharacterized protein (DUF849 family)